MSGYIDAEKFDKTLTALIMMQPDEWFCRETNEAMQLVRKAEDSSVVENVVPVVHAHWIEVPLKKFLNEYKLQCSNCEKISIAKHNYCPYCGAKMDEEV